MTRRRFVQAAVLAAQPVPSPTRFQIGCMTLPYAAFPLARALEGIARGGFRFVGWGTTHQESPGVRRPVLAPEATAAQARQLAARCRRLGLEPGPQSSSWGVLRWSLMANARTSRQQA